MARRENTQKSHYCTKEDHQHSHLVIAMNIKDNQAILKKLGIDTLNPMQIGAGKAIMSNTDVLLLSPTGTGKTLAFLLPIIESLDPACSEIQALIIVPSRELAIQIEQVIREMGTGYKTNAVYGGRAGAKDKIELKHRPAILIGTPGRVADHLRRERFSVENITTLVLDEFDKSLEIGFEVEMQEIIGELTSVNKRVLTSATQGIEIPSFLGFGIPKIIDFLEEGVSQLKVKLVLSPSKDKLETLVDLLCNIGNQPGIIFCNFKDSIERVSEFLTKNNISHGCFFGGLEQQDRERALIKFRNGTFQILIATDLAARGIDVPELKFIIHYHLPLKSEEFTHRNGRTARMNSEGTAFVLKWEHEDLPEFIETKAVETLIQSAPPSPSKWETLFISGGRKDKISKGDIAGLFFKQGKLKNDQLGMIELKQDCAFVAVPKSEASWVIQQVNNTKLKKKKVRVSIV
jgi:superfamily II DNA/RNA helicase